MDNLKQRASDGDSNNPPIIMRDNIRIPVSYVIAALASLTTGFGGAVLSLNAKIDAINEAMHIEHNAAVSAIRTLLDSKADKADAKDRITKTESDTRFASQERIMKERAEALQRQTERNAQDIRELWKK